MVLTHVPAYIWSTLKFLAMREPIQGFGRLLEEVP